MRVYDETIAAMTRDPDIVRLYEALSAGDRSILVALLDDDRGVGATSRGSANAQFWQCMSDHGWMAQVDTGISDPTGLMLNFCITDLGYRAIPVLLSALRSPGF